MTRARGWWFEKSDDSIFIIFDYRENPSRLRKKGGSSAVYSSVAKFKAYSGIGDDAIKVYFTDKNDHPYKLLRSSFVWNKNDVCRQFRDLRSPQEFCDHFNSVLSGKEDTSSPASSVSNLTNDSSEDDSEPEGESETTENISHSSSNGIESTPDDDDDVMSPTASMSNTPLSRSTKKRKLTDAAKQLVLPTLSKKKKAEKLNKEMSEEELSMKESIRDCHIGTGPFLIDISALELGKQARAPDDKWVDKLEAAMEDYLDEAYQPLIVVLKNESKENFRESNVNGYTYEVIGGQHSFLAVKRLSEKYGNRKELKSRLAVVYAGLSDEQRKWLAHRHNATVEFHHSMTFKEKVQMCRDRYEEMPDIEAKEEQWEKSCAMILKEKADSLFMKICCAVAKMRHFSLMMEVFAMYEEGRTRSQNLKPAELRGLKRPEIPFRKLGDFLRLNNNDQKWLLEEIISTEISVTELVKESAVLRKLDLVQRFFVMITGCVEGGWEEARQRFPNETTREKLEQFVNLSYSRGVPAQFESFCQRAVILEKNKEDASKTAVFATDGAYGFTIHNADVLDLNASSLKQQCPGFRGIDLTLVDMPSEWSASDIQRLMITIKAINVDCQQSAFNIAVICRASEMGEIMQAFKRDKNFVSVQPVFCHVQSCSSTRRFGLIEAVQCMVVAMYCSQDKNPIQHPTEERHNMWSCDTPQRTYDHVIQTFSHRGGWILHIFSGSGNGMISSLKNGRHCIVTDHSSDQLAILCDNVSQFVGTEEL